MTTITDEERQALRLRANGDPSAVPWCDSGERMTDRRHLPQWLYAANVLRAVLCADGCEVDPWRAQAIQTQLEQFVRTATWHLSWLEEEMGFADGELNGLTLDERRDRICGRLRSWRLPTAHVVSRVANAYLNGQVEAIMDYPAHVITIRFVSEVGRPSNVTDLQAELLRILPARLDVRWEYRYLVWGELLEAGTLWQDLLASGITWDQLRTTAPDDLPPLLTRRAPL